MKVKRAKKEGAPLRKTAKQSGKERLKKKLTASSSWFKKKKSKGDEYDGGHRRLNRKDKKKKNEMKTVKQRSVLFVEQTRKGELATNLRMLLARIAPTLKFSVKIVERAGASLRSKFSQGALWEGILCGRGE